MNIVFFTRHFYPHIGGVEKHVLKISQNLSRNHAITVFTELHDTALPLIDQFENITIYRIPITKNEKQKKFEIWRYLLEKRQIFGNADIIHIHDVFYWYLPFRFLYPFKKVYMTFHGYEGNSLPTRRAIISHKIAEIMSYGNICIGDYLRKWYKTRPTIVSYGAITKRKLSSLGQNTTKTKQSKTKALYIGRLEKEAGIMEYLRLVKRLIDNKQKISLTVLGDGTLYTQALSYVRRYRLPVVFKGFVPEVESYIGQYDIVFTSRYLGTLEALYYKKPVLSVYNNAIKRDCFTLSPFGQWIALASSVDELKKKYDSIREDHKMVERNIKKAYDWVREETWEKMATHYLKLWGVHK